MNFGHWRLKPTTHEEAIIWDYYFGVHGSVIKDMSEYIFLAANRIDRVQFHWRARWTYDDI